MSVQYDCCATAIYQPRMSTLATAICLAFAALPIAAQAQVSEFILPTLGGTFSNASAVSADGAVVVGNAATAGGNNHAFRWAGAGGMADLGTLGGNGSSASAVSADGTVVVGEANTGSGSHAFRWTNNVMTDLGTLGGSTSYARAVSADGAVVVGESNTGSGPHAFRWTGAGGMSDLGTLGGTQSYALAVSADGAVVVGYARLAGNTASHAFRWTGADGMSDLGTLGGTLSYATAVSADGAVVVGHSYTTAGNNNIYHAFRWTNNVMTDLGTLGGNYSGANSVSADGAVAAGRSYTAGDAAYHAFRWTSAGMADLGTLGGTNSYARAISADGAVVVGEADTAGDAAQRAFRWSSPTGMQSVEDWLRAAGVTVTSDFTRIANATNRDGSVVVGQTAAGTAFIARVVSPVTPPVEPPVTPPVTPPGGPGSGLLLLDAALASSLSSVSGVTQSLLSGSEMVMNGMHGMPLNYRIAEGQSTVWGGGDWGRYTQDSDTNGNVGVGEIGGGYNFGPAQLNGAVGYSQNKQDLSSTSTQKSTGTYLYGEVLAPLTKSIWGVLSGYYQWGDADVKRGYQNAGTDTSSSGSPDTTTWVLRTRVEWEAMVDPAGPQLNPYGDLSYARAKMDGYTENSGAFPVSYDERTDNGTDLRVGVNGSYPLATGKQTRLLGKVEGVHRFQDNASNVKGGLLGPGGFDFSYDGTSYDQDWMRAGIGAETMLGSGKAVVMLNGATRGESPNVWLNASYQVAF